MGLIARAVEASGIPTVSMTSALSITRAANPPRAAFLDYPLGHTSGKPGEPELQKKIVREALSALETLTVPGSTLEMDYRWADTDDWKDAVMRPATAGGEDNRQERFPDPQYQCAADQLAAERELELHGECPTCIFPDTKERAS